MPEHLKAQVWDRFVDDVFAIYRGSESDFEEFFTLLNSWDRHIQFTCERSYTGVECGLGDRVVEALPFLDLMVTRHLDRDSETVSNKLAIYRKPCHSGTYMHYMACQPVSMKRSVIRSIFLRAFRYCDAEFLNRELSRIYEDFTKLGYPRKFIDKAKFSAKKGREHEKLVRAGQAEPKPPRTRQPYTLMVPYHEKTRRLKQLYMERGIDVIYSSRDSIGNRVKHNDVSNHTGVYVIRCSDSACDEVYVGESGNLPQRFKDHRDAQSGQPSKAHYATAKHKHISGNLMLDVDNAVVPYRSASRFRRRIVEASLITLCTTVTDTKATSCVRDMDVIGPIVLESVPFNWKQLAAAHPTMPQHAVPRIYRKFFFHQ